MESELVFYELQLVKITPMQGNLRLEKVSRKRAPRGTFRYFSPCNIASVITSKAVEELPDVKCQEAWLVIMSR